MQYRGQGVPGIRFNC